jgi:hypothetical protein
MAVEYVRRNAICFEDERTYGNDSVRTVVMMTVALSRRIPIQLSSCC